MHLFRTEKNCLAIYIYTPVCLYIDWTNGGGDGWWWWWWTNSCAPLSHIQTHIHTRTRSHPDTPTHTLTLTLPLTFTLTQSDTQKNKMHIWGSPRQVIFDFVLFFLFVCFSFFIFCRNIYTVYIYMCMCVTMPAWCTGSHSAICLNVVCFFVFVLKFVFCVFTTFFFVFYFFVFYVFVFAFVFFCVVLMFFKCFSPPKNTRKTQHKHKQK